MPILAPELLDLLADPETHEPLTLANEAELAALKTAIQQGKARRRDGQAGPGEFDGALFTQNRKVAYLIVGGIPNLLVDERLELAS